MTNWRSNGRSRPRNIQSCYSFQPPRKCDSAESLNVWVIRKCDSAESLVVWVINKPIALAQDRLSMNKLTIAPLFYSRKATLQFMYSGRHWALLQLSVIMRCRTPTVLLSVQCHGWPSTQPGTCTQPCPIVHTAVLPLFTQPCPGITMSTAVCIYVARLCASCPAV